MDNLNFDIEKKNQIFSSFIEDYKEKSLVDKQSLVVKDLKELIATIQQLCYLNGVNHELLINREITDINTLPYSEDDFAEAVYVYIQMFKELLSDALIPMIEDDEDV